MITGRSVYLTEKDIALILEALDMLQADHPDNEEIEAGALRLETKLLKKKGG